MSSPSPPPEDDAQQPPQRRRSEDNTVKFGRDLFSVQLEVRACTPILGHMLLSVNASASDQRHDRYGHPIICFEKPSLCMKSGRMV